MLARRFLESTAGYLNTNSQILSKVCFVLFFLSREYLEKKKYSCFVSFSIFFFGSQRNRWKQQRRRRRHSVRENCNTMNSRLNTLWKFFKSAKWFSKSKCEAERSIEWVPVLVCTNRWRLPRHLPLPLCVCVINTRNWFYLWEFATVEHTYKRTCTAHKQFALKIVLWIFSGMWNGVWFAAIIPCRLVLPPHKIPLRLVLVHDRDLDVGKSVCTALIYHIACAWCTQMSVMSAFFYIIFHRTEFVSRNTTNCCKPNPSCVCVQNIRLHVIRLCVYFGHAVK